MSLKIKNIRKCVALMLLILCVFQLASCSSEAEPEEKSEVKIDYGSSELYSKKDMDAAIKVIKDEFGNWKGFELQRIYYSSDDECNEENIDWLNQIEKADDNKEAFTQCIMFYSDFHTPKRSYLDQLIDFSSFEEDEDYTAWQWWLARSEGGEWKIVTWGY